MVPGMFFVERWIDKFILASTWMEGVTGNDIYTHCFFLVYFITAMVYIGLTETKDLVH